MEGGGNEKALRLGEGLERFMFGWFVDRSRRCEIMSVKSGRSSFSEDEK